jgi:hypothetical protein
MEAFAETGGDKYRSFIHGEGEKNTVWRLGAPPNYDVVNKLFEEERTKVLNMSVCCSTNESFAFVSMMNSSIVHHELLRSLQNITTGKSHRPQKITPSDQKISVGKFVLIFRLLLT